MAKKSKARTSSTRGSSGTRRLRSPKRRTIDWQLIALWIVLIVGLLWSTYYLLTNPRFYIRQVRIDGIQTVSLSKVAAAAAAPRNSNVFLFWLTRRKAYCEKVLACDPAIESDSVAIGFPHTLRVLILERQPYTVLNIPNSSAYLMDINQVPYRTVALNRARTPIINIPGTAEHIEKGSSLPADINSHVTAAYYLLGLLESRQIGPLSDVEDVTVDQYDNVNLRLHSQLVIKLGQSAGLPDRLSAVETALTADPSLVSKAKYLDFTTSRPAIMEKSSPPASLSTDASSSSTSVPISSDIGH